MKPADLAEGRVYPPLTRIREVSLAIATAVAGEAHDTGTARATRPNDLRADIERRMFQPIYQQYA